MDVHNTRDQLDAAIRKVKARPGYLTELTRHNYTLGRERGFDQSILALCDAVLAAAAEELNASEDAPGDGPVGGDREAEANYLFGIYEQLQAAFAVARASRG